MSVKTIFGSILTILGVIGLIYAAVMFVSSQDGTSKDIKSLIVFGLLGLLFFISGINIIRTTKDES